MDLVWQHKRLLPSGCGWSAGYSFFALVLYCIFALLGKAWHVKMRPFAISKEDSVYIYGGPRIRLCHFSLFCASLLSSYILLFLGISSLQLSFWRELPCSMWLIQCICLFFILFTIEVFFSCTSCNTLFSWSLPVFSISMLQMPWFIHYWQGRANSGWMKMDKPLPWGMSNMETEALAMYKNMKEIGQEFAYIVDEQSVVCEQARNSAWKVGTIVKCHYNWGEDDFRIQNEIQPKQPWVTDEMMKIMEERRKARYQSTEMAGAECRWPFYAIANIQYIDRKGI